MKFKDKYPEAEPLELEVEPQLEKSPRIFACSGCGFRTGWRYIPEGCPGIPCCSDDCLAELSFHQSQIAKDLGLFGHTPTTESQMIAEGRLIRDPLSPTLTPEISPW